MKGRQFAPWCRWRLRVKLSHLSTLAISPVQLQQLISPEGPVQCEVRSGDDLRRSSGMVTCGFVRLVGRNMRGIGGRR